MKPQIPLKSIPTTRLESNTKPASTSPQSHHYQNIQKYWKFITFFLFLLKFTILSKSIFGFEHFRLTARGRGIDESAWKWGFWEIEVSYLQQILSHFSRLILLTRHQLQLAECNFFIERDVHTAELRAANVCMLCMICIFDRVIARLKTEMAFNLNGIRPERILRIRFVLVRMSFEWVPYLVTRFAYVVDQGRQGRNKEKQFQIYIEIHQLVSIAIY